MDFDKLHTINVYKVKINTWGTLYSDSGDTYEIYDKSTEKYFTNIGMAIAYARAWREKTYADLGYKYCFDGFTTEKDRIVFHYHIEWLDEKADHHGRKLREGKLRETLIHSFDVIDVN